MPQVDAATSEETISFTTVLVPVLSWDPATDREIIARPGRTWVEGAAGLMPREGTFFLGFHVDFVVSPVITTKNSKNVERRLFDYRVHILTRSSFNLHITYNFLDHVISQLVSVSNMIIICRRCQISCLCGRVWYVWAVEQSGRGCHH